jgi:hypothetical protein
MIAAMHMTVAKTHLPEGLALVRLRPSVPRRRKSSISVHPIAKKKKQKKNLLALRNIVNKRTLIGSD